MTHLKEGMKAPPFSGKDKNGTTVSLENFKGKKIVLYFYPKDNTAGCTAEACSLNSYYGDFVKKDYAVVGVSPDSEASHQRFAAKYELKFNLLSDVNHEIAIAYGVWSEKKMYGKTYMGIIRTTFIIDENGVIEKIIDKVDTQNHAAQILN